MMEDEGVYEYVYNGDSSSAYLTVTGEFTLWLRYGVFPSDILCVSLKPANRSGKNARVIDIIVALQPCRAISCKLYRTRLPSLATL